MAIDPYSAVPIYRQIADHIRGAVAAGIYQPGEAIPSLRALALDLVVNPNTVQRAYEHLEREGLIQARKGLGMFVTTNGSVSALEKTEDAVYAGFADGIRVGLAAKMQAGRIRQTFDAAWREARGKGGVKKP